jgi:site-specific recombinase XerD
MTPLRQRMTDDMRLRNLALPTQLAYLHYVTQFARHFGKSPHQLGPEEVRTYQVFLLNEKKLSTSSLRSTAAALRFLYKVTLKKDWAVEAIPIPKMPHTLPVILSRQEVIRFLESAGRSVRDRRTREKLGARLPGAACWEQQRSAVRTVDKMVLQCPMESVVPV